MVLASGVQRLLQLYRVKPGNRALVVTNNDFGFTVACDLLAAGVEVAAVVDARAALPEDNEHVQQLKGVGVPMWAAHSIQAARGRKHVEGALIVPLDAEGRAVAGAARSVSCDLICLSTGFAPASALLTQSGCQLAYDAALGEIVPRQMAATVFAAGDVSGVHHLPAILLQGRIAGLQAAMSLGLKDAESTHDRSASYQQELAEIEQQYRAAHRRLDPS